MHTTGPIDEVLVHLEVERRRRRLFLMALAGGGAGLAGISILAAGIEPGQQGLLVVILSVLGGVIIGLGHAPILGAALARKRLAVAVPIVYGGAFAMAVGLVVARQPVWAILAFSMCVPVFSLFALLLRSQALVHPGRCPSCGYDTSGSRSDACPECGAALMTMKPVGPVSEQAGQT